jgi:hypothetical protein
MKMSWQEGGMCPDRKEEFVLVRKRNMSLSEKGICQDRQKEVSWQAGEMYPGRNEAVSLYM